MNPQPSALRREALLLCLLLPPFLILDLTWIGICMQDFYNTEMGDLARRVGGAMAPRWSAALPVYLLLPAGIVLFVRPRLTPGAGLPAAFGWGAVYGLIVYGVYDLTNMAVLEKWTWRMTACDIAWGCVLCGLSAALLTLIERKLPAPR